MATQRDAGHVWSYLRPLAVFAVASLVWLSVARAGLLLWQYERVAATGMTSTVLLQGVRFDLVVVGFLLLLPVAGLLPFTTTRFMTLRGRPLLLAYLLVAFAALVFMEAATPAFVAQYDSRPNRLFFEYLVYPKEVASTLLAGYSSHLIAAAIGIALLTKGLQRALQPALAVPGRALSFGKALAATGVLLLACLLAMRSSFDHRAVNPSMAAVTRDPLVNDFALNSTYSVLYAAYELRTDPEGGFRYGEMTDAEALGRVQSGMRIDAADFVAGPIPTLHRQRATLSPPRPKNLVIVLEESLGAEFVGALGGLPITPNLDALAKQGWWFENLYATGTRSVRGLEALITGFTPTPAPSVVKLSRSQRNFYTLARTLKAAGYDTSFIYGGEGQFDNMRRFFMNNGFDTVIDEDDYSNPVFHGSWGVSDEDVFTRADEEFSKPRERPFFTLLFTTTNHSPYEYPEGRITPFDADPHTVNNAVKYADHALGQFFARAREQPYWNDTVFLVVADHNSRVLGAELVPIARFHIPGLVLGGGVAASAYRPVASQIDLPPTLLSLIGVSATHPMIGHDLTRPEFATWPGRAIMQYDETQAYMAGNKVAILRRDLPPATFVYDGGIALTSVPPDEDLVATAIAHATWTSSALEGLHYRLP